MIDEQHPMQIGMFPMDMKCHTPQQLQQQQLQQQQQTGMLMSGNERMLTTSTAAAASTTATKPTTNGNGAMPLSTTPTTTTVTPNETLRGKNGTTSTPTNVNGSCNNHNNSNSNNNSCSHNNNSNNNNNSKTNNGHNQQSNACGPGPPPSPHGHLANATNALTSVSGRVTLGECSLNGGGCGASASIGSLCVNNNNNNNGAVLSLQQQLQQQQQQHHQPHQHHQHQQHQQQQLHLQLHPSHSMALLQQAPHPAAMLATSNTSVAAISSLSLSCGGVGAGASGGSPLTQCGYCCQPICDRYIMRVVDTSFHEGCLKCATCSLHLQHSCFARDGKLYCRIDYERLFIRNRCLGCGHKIASDELVMRTLENVFHLKCFACVVCGALLKKGEQYVVKQGQLFCRFDYEKEVEMLQGYDFYGDDLFPPKLDGRRGPKRPRTILNTQQRRAFKASFEVSPKPCRKVRENLAKETGLSLRIVQVWFQNQRAKVKKIQKKAKQEPAKGASDSQDSQESDSSLAKIKDEAHSDTESLLESPFSSCGAGGGSSSDGVAKLRCIKDENENAPFNCIETNKENCNKTNEPILNTILGLSYATFQQLMGPFTQSPMINPIDRLYSMQNSYFRPEELSYGECGGKDMSDN